MGSNTPVNMATVQNINEELADMPNDKMDATGPPEQSAMIIEHRNQPDSTRTEHNGPIHDRRVHREINAIFVAMDNSEIYFRIDHPELLPLRNYVRLEWSEFKDLFQPIIDFAEEIYSDWSPARRPLVSASKCINKTNIIKPRPFH